MKCPSCATAIPESPEACPQCGFHLEELTLRFGALPRHSIYVTDTTMHRVLTPRRQKAVERKLVYFTKKFPQSRFSVVFTQLRSHTPIREYTFYLMNKCQFSAFSQKGAKNFSLLLLVDVTTGDACLMTGYGLETWLSEDELLRILTKAKASFAHGDFYKATIVCIYNTMITLRNNIKARKGLDL